MSAHHTADLEETTSITNPNPTMDIRAYGLYGCWEKQSRTLTVWSYVRRHQAKGLLHWTSIALSLARGLSQSDRLFPLPLPSPPSPHTHTHKLTWIPIQKQDLASAMGIMRRARDVDQYPQAQPDGNREREAENTDQDAAARGVI